MSGTEQYFTVMLNVLYKTFDPVDEIIFVCIGGSNLNLYYQYIIKGKVMRATKMITKEDMP